MDKSGIYQRPSVWYFPYERYAKIQIASSQSLSGLDLDQGIFLSTRYPSGSVKWRKAAARLVMTGRVAPSSSMFSVMSRSPQTKDKAAREGRSICETILWRHLTVDK